MRAFTLVFRVGWKIIFDYFHWIIRYNRHKEKYPLELRFKRVQNLVSFVVKRMGVKYDIENFDKLYETDDKKLIICNHQSMFDPLFFLYKAKRPITFISKIEVRKFPFVGKILNIIDGEFLDRANLKQAVKVIVNSSKLIQEQKYDVVVFPEGTRLKEVDKDLKEFHAGSFKIPYKAKCPVAACNIFGSYRVLKFFKYRKKELYVQFKVTNVYSYESFKDLNTVALTDDVYEKLNTESKEMYKKEVSHDTSLITKS